MKKTSNLLTISKILPLSTVLSVNRSQLNSNFQKTDFNETNQQSQTYSPAVINFDLQSPNRFSNEGGFSLPPSASSTLSNGSKRKRKLSTEGDQCKCYLTADT